MADENQIPILVDLRGEDLGGRDLSGVDLRGRDLGGASFRGANLSNADLRDTRGLLTEQFAGANLTSAKLPEQLAKQFENMQNVKDISESARKLFLAVLGACLYCWLTIATTTDVNLITNRNSSVLPIIQTSIPIVGFYIVGPILVLCIYFYFHFYLQKLWEELGSFPAVFPDGKPLHTKVDPWLLNDLVRSHLPTLNPDSPFLSYLQLGISVMLAWLVVPITMVLFWGRYLRRHEPIGTTLHVALLAVSLVAAISLYQLAVATLRGAPRMPFTWNKALTNLRGYRTAYWGVAAAVLFGLVSLDAIHADSPYSYTWVTRAMDFIGDPTFPILTDADVSQKKPNWSSKNEKDKDSVIGAQLYRANLRHASADEAFLADAKLLYADLTGASLTDADLTDADLRGADLTRAHMTGAHLNDADLFGAHLNDADLDLTDLNGANLYDADLTGAGLIGANLTGAHLNFADLTGATLNGANLTYCDFRNIRNLDSAQAKSGRHWESAYYDDAMLNALGLAPDHNDRLDEQRKKETNPK